MIRATLNLHFAHAEDVCTDWGEKVCRLNDGCINHRLYDADWGKTDAPRESIILSRQM